MSTTNDTQPICDVEMAELLTEEQSINALIADVRRVLAEADAVLQAGAVLEEADALLDDTMDDDASATTIDLDDDGGAYEEIESDVTIEIEGESDDEFLQCG